jgi:SanA protein
MSRSAKTRPQGCSVGAIIQNIRTLTCRMWRSRPLRRLVKSVTLVLAAAILIILGLNALIVFGTADCRYEHAGEIPLLADCGEPFQAIIVLGARVWEDGRPSHVLEDRLATGLELYRLGQIRKIIVSGDHGSHCYDEVNTMGGWLMAAGVPQEDVFLDHAGFNTYDTMTRAARVFGVRRAVVVTQRFHLPRAVWLARQAGIDAVGVEADRRRYRSHYWNEGRESLARVKCVWEALLGRDPKYLGPMLPIEGDGRLTWDNRTIDMISRQD